MSVYYKGTKFTAQGVDDYEQLQNKPYINNILLSGHVTLPVIDVVGALPTIPDSSKLYRLGTTLNWYNGTGWVDLSSANLGSVGNTTNPVYSLNGSLVQGSTYAGGTSLTLNGTSKAASTASIYAPVVEGTSGQVLKSNGTNQAPTWQDVELSLNGATKTVTKETAYFYAPTAGGTVGQILKSNGINNAPTWQDAASDAKLTLNGSEKDVTPTDVNIYAPITSGTSGQVLKSKGANQAPEWVNATSGGQTSWYGTCTSDGSLQAKDVTCEDYELTVGAMISVYFSNANTITSPTLNVNETGAKQIKCSEQNVEADTAWAAGQVVTFVYDGTYYKLISIDQPAVTYGSCTTAVGTAAKTVTIPGFKLMKGAVIYVSFSYPHISGTAATLNVNSTGAKTIRNWGQNITTNNGTSWMANDLVCLVYDGTYWQMTGSSNIPVGTITMFGGANIPAGWILCNGSNISRTTYNKLYAVIGTTFGTGDGSTTFTLPDFRQRFPQGAGNGSLKGATPSLGTKTAPGIPDIYGKLGRYEGWKQYAAGSGAFSTSSNYGEGGSGGSGDGFYDNTFRASNGEVPSTSSTTVQNNVYGKSATVQPASLAVNFVIRYA